MIPFQRGRGRGHSSKFIRRGVNSASSSKGSPISKQVEGSSFSDILKTSIVPPLKKSFQDFIIYLQESDRRLFSNPTALAKQYFELDQDFPIINQKSGNTMKPF